MKLARFKSDNYLKFQKYQMRIQPERKFRVKLPTFAPKLRAEAIEVWSRVHWVAISTTFSDIG